MKFLIYYGYDKWHYTNHWFDANSTFVCDNSTFGNPNKGEQKGCSFGYNPSDNEQKWFADQDQGYSNKVVNINCKTLPCIVCGKGHYGRCTQIYGPNNVWTTYEDGSHGYVLQLIHNNDYQKSGFEWDGSGNYGVKWW